MVLFILFPGFGNSEKYWENKIDMKKNKVYLKKLDFLNNLKKIGKVYKYTPKLHNLNYYRTGINEEYGKIYCNQFNKPTKITLDDINIDKECKRIFDLLKDKNEKFILIGHSIGSWFAYNFSKMYPSYCLNTIFLDGSFLVLESINNIRNRYVKKQKKVNIKFKDINNKKLDFLYKKVISHVKEDRYEYNKKINKYIKKIFDISLNYYYYTMKKKFNSKLKIPNISFRNLNFNKEKKSIDHYTNIDAVNNEEELYNKNKNKAIVHYLVNSGHTQWKRKKFSDFIIKEIKEYLKK
jgi:hypothetical protein